MIIADFNKKARGNEVQKLIANSFSAGRWYSASHIKTEISRIFELVGLKPQKAVTSNTITDFFEAKKMEHKKQRGYYLIRSRILQATTFFCNKSFYIPCSNFVATIKTQSISKILKV